MLILRLVPLTIVVIGPGIILIMLVMASSAAFIVAAVESLAGSSVAPEGSISSIAT